MLALCDPRPRRHMSTVLQCKYVHVWVGQLGSVKYVHRDHAMWIALDNGPIRFFSLEKDNENNETLHDTLWQHNSLHTCRKVPGCLFPDVEEYCGDFEAEWNWRGDEADYVVHVNFTRDTTFSAVVGSASDTHVEYTGYRFINGRSQEWCKLYVLCTPFRVVSC